MTVSSCRLTAARLRRRLTVLACVATTTLAGAAILTAAPVHAVAPHAVAPHAIAPRDVAPDAVAPHAVARRAVAPRTLAKAATPPAGSPLGKVDVLTRVPGGLKAGGWVFDPDQPTSADAVYALIDGVNIHSAVWATIPRSDVAAAYPAAGAAHGFSWTIPVPEGRHTVCVRAGNLGRGGAVDLRCFASTFRYGPAGAFESMTTTPGEVHIRGFAVDGDAWTTPVTLTVSVDGTTSTMLADTTRTDVAKTYPAAGKHHGFDATYRLAQGAHRICVGAHNIGYGSYTALGCRTAVLDDRPVGAMNAPQSVKGTLRIWGWAFDRDTPTSPITVSVTLDSGLPFTLTANRSRPDVGRVYPGTGTSHGFDYSTPIDEGTHTVCVVARNVGYGSDRSLGCRTIVVDYTPKASLATATATSTGMAVSGWAYDPDTSKAVSTRILLDGHAASVVSANRKGRTHSGHNFTAAITARSGRHTVCAIAVNLLWGTHDSTASCRTLTLSLSPLGAFESLTRVAGSDALSVTGFALDPDTTAPLTVQVTVDGQSAPSLTADAPHPNTVAKYPTLGPDHGLSALLGTNDQEHRVCLTAVDVGGGSDLSLGCKLVYAVHPVAPAAPGPVTAVAGYGGATLSWSAPVSDGGAPLSKYTVTVSPGGLVVPVSAGSPSAVIVGLRASTVYSFAVQALNPYGSSPSTVSAAVKTQAGPPAQRTPAPVSTSRYIRNLRGASPTDLATMRAEGATDAQHNASGHGYIVLLDIGGQDAYDGGVVLSAGVRFVSYADLVSGVQAYLDGYAGAQRPSAPVVVAVGTNNDMDVSSATGATWATKVVNPLAAYARHHVGMTVAGANDMEPGFRASYSATRSWLSGYLAATSAPFVFNGSADGCAWTVTNRRCNNGWTMAGLHYLAGAAAPTRILNLPQVYNNTMADQWKYISLTGVVNGLARINFAGVLTEYTACAQAGGCGSMSGHSAWTRMWNDLQSDRRLQVSSLPYSTDLRIDR